MLVEKLPVKREWEFYDDDDVVITFSMKDSGTLIPLAGMTSIAEIRDADSSTATLLSTATCSITSDIITARFPLVDLANLVGSTVYGELRLLDTSSYKITLLKFTATMNATFARFTLPT